MSKKDIKFDKRKEDEKSEGYKTVKTDLPPERFQDEKQVLTPDQLSVDKSSIAGTEGPKTIGDAAKSVKRIESSMKVKPTVSVEELNGKQVGGVPLAGLAETRSVAGVSNMSPADDYSKIPYSGGNYRPDTRYGKKRGEDLFILDNQISEQIAPEVDDALDLSESPDSKQGYNGRKQFKQVRGKKNFSFTNGSGHAVGKLPQQLLNDSSVDYQHTSKIVYTCGQMITGKNDSDSISIPVGGDYPSLKYDGTSTSFRMHKGNYKPKNLIIKCQNGKITDVKIEEDYFELHPDPITRDEANFNMQVDINNVAKTVIRLQNDLGRETSDKWSPLGYVIYEPYENNMLSHDIEATLGAIMTTAYRSACCSIAQQRNVNGKDGVNPQINAIKMILEGYAGILANDDPTTIKNSEFNKMIWRKSAFQAGSVAGLIDMFDTTGKYHTKADILGLQRSLTLHLAQADNNLNPLHCKPDFIKALNKAHMYSTVDGNYNPMLPVCQTRTIKLVNPLSLNAFLIGWKNPASLSATEKVDPLRDVATGTYSNFSYRYTDQRNRYTTRVQHPVIEGLLTWLLKHEGAFCSTFGNNDSSEATVTIPFEFNFETPNLLSFMLCSASYEIMRERNDNFRDIIFAGQQSEYIWPDLVGLDKLNPLYSTQFKYNGYKEALTLGKLAPDTIVREMWSEQMQITKYDNGKAQYMMPWHYNEVAFTNSYTRNEGFRNERSAFNMSIPSIRKGLRHEYVDTIKSMSERDIRLSLDRRVDIPLFCSEETITTGGTTLWTKYSNYNTASTLNDDVKFAALRYDANSDGRLIVIYDLTHNANKKLTEKSLYLCAKEIGYIEDDYDGYKVITEADYSNNDLVVTTVNLDPYSKGGTGNTAWFYNGYAPVYLDSYRVYEDNEAAKSIDRSAALTQVFYRIFASIKANTSAINQKFIAKTGIVPCLGYNDGDADDVYGVYNIDSDNESSNALDTTIRTNARRIWTMLQRFFMPINRFENIFNVTSKVDFDPLENCIYFGFCGTLASDYTQDVLERLDVYDQLALDYTEDYYHKETPILRLD